MWKVRSYLKMYTLKVVMLIVYFNYFNSMITIHTNSGCPMIQSQRKATQRYIFINALTISQELQRFQSKFYRFASTAKFNDMVLEIDFGNRSFEEAVVYYIHHLLSHYTPLSNATPQICRSGKC
jgi:hypothetical protein